MSKKPTSLRAIRNYCRKCVGGGIRAIKKCPHVGCILFPYRMGKDPGRKGVGNRNPRSEFLRFGR